MAQPLPLLLGQRDGLLQLSCVCCNRFCCCCCIYHDMMCDCHYVVHLLSCCYVGQVWSVR